MWSFFRMHFPPTPDASKIEAMNAKLSQRDISISAHGVESFSSDHQANETFLNSQKKRVFEIFQPIRSRIPLKVSIDWWLNTIFA